MIKKRTFLKTMSAGLAAGATTSILSTPSSLAAETTSGTPQQALKPGEVQHMVIFNLKHDKESQDTLKFIQDGRRILTAIPVVRNFQAFTQVSKKNDYDFGFSMIFSNRADYEKYNSHPDHVGFVEQRWNKEVSRFLEIDFEAKA
jgi:hypothetical protein